MDTKVRSFVCEHGIESMDTEHHALAKLFDAFVTCIRMDDSREAADSLIQQAITCANAHFEHEEQLMAQTAYPNAEDHKFRHRNLRLQFTTLIGDTVAVKAHDPVTLEHLDVMRNLLEDHISGPDGELAAHLKAAGLK
jgi:hemerythrin-like metal-binding protein